MNPDAPATYFLPIEDEIVVLSPDARQVFIRSLAVRRVDQMQILVHWRREGVMRGGPGAAARQVRLVGVDAREERELGDPCQSRRGGRCEDTWKGSSQRMTRWAAN